MRMTLLLNVPYECGSLIENGEFEEKSQGFEVYEGLAGTPESLNRKNAYETGNCVAHYREVIRR